MADVVEIAPNGTRTRRAASRSAASAGTGPSRRAGPLAAPSVIAVQVDDQHRRRR